LGRLGDHGGGIQDRAMVEAQVEVGEVGGDGLDVVVDGLGLSEEGFVGGVCVGEGGTGGVQ
jgi:hypothetical protein